MGVLHKPSTTGYIPAGTEREQVRPFVDRTMISMRNILVSIIPICLCYSGFVLRLNAEVIGFEFTGAVRNSFSDPWGAHIPSSSQLTGRFLYDTTSVVTHPFADCGGNCAGYRQQIENGFFADFNGIRIQADDYIVGVFDNVPAPGGVDDVFAIRFHSDLDPPPTRPLLVDGFLQSIGFFNISLVGDTDIFSGPSLPVDLDLTDFDPQSPGILSDAASGQVDVLFRLTTLSKLPASLGDYEFDRDVDGDDYGRWKIVFGSTIDLAADGNGNMVVDAADYTIWRDNVGTNGNHAASSSFNTVPEPSTMLSLLAAVVTALIIPARPVFSYHLHRLHVI